MTNRMLPCQFLGATLIIRVVSLAIIMSRWNPFL